MNYEIILIVIAGCLACVYFGHWMTLKSIGYVQPSIHEIAKASKPQSSVYTEEDPWEEKVEPDSPSDVMSGLPQDVVDSLRMSGVDTDNFVRHNDDSSDDET